MIVNVLAATARTAIEVCIITPAEYSCVWEIFREEMAKPIDAIVCLPRFFAMAIEAMNGHNTGS